MKVKATESTIEKEMKIKIFTRQALFSYAQYHRGDIIKMIVQG